MVRSESIVEVSKETVAMPAKEHCLMPKDLCQTQMQNCVVAAARALGYV